MTDFSGDMRDITGPDRVLPCGCHVIDGAICFVVPSTMKLDTRHFYQRSGRIIMVDGSANDVVTPKLKDEHGTSLET